MTDDIRKLLAGYATGTLTEAERRALFEAALGDEDLFAAISNEEPLRELLADPLARAELLARIEPASVTFRERFAAWLRRPSVAAGFATAAVAVVVISVVPLLREQRVSESARLSSRTFNPQMTTLTPEPSRDVAKTTTQTVPRPRKSANVLATAPATAPRQEVAQSAAASTAMELRDEPAAVDSGRLAGNLQSPAAASLPPPQTPPVPPPSAGMAALPREAVEVRADAAHLVAASKAANQATTPARLIILRKTPSGDYSEVDPAKTVFSAGDVVRIRIEPGEGGLVNVQGATPQPIVGALTKGRSFETGDILIGIDDMRLIIQFSAGFPVARTIVSSLRTSQTAEAAPAQPVEIILRVKKP